VTELAKRGAKGDLPVWKPGTPKNPSTTTSSPVGKKSRKYRKASAEAVDEKGPGAGFKVDLFEGDSDWPKVLAALDEVGYAGWMITEQYRPPGLEDAAWLAQLSAKLDAVIAS
jgi:hexulose-6-phosphate isomerase